jgi:predicted metalloprotease with PDZ domain
MKQQPYPVEISPFPRRQLSTRRRIAWLGLLLALLAPLGSAISAQTSDGDSVLKMDVPKLDTSSVRKTLKGGIFHHEAIVPRSIKLQSSAANNSAKLQDRDSKLTAGTGKSGILNKLFKAKIKAAPTFNPVIQNGIGIIGVKFVLGFGLPPTINRVFPGTPAQMAGLKNNDIIVAVDGIPTSGLTKEEVYAMIVGTPDTPVTVSVLRNGDFVPKTMNRMDFNDIPDPSVRRDYLMSI